MIEIVLIILAERIRFVFEAAHKIIDSKWNEKAKKKRKKKQ